MSAEVIQFKRTPKGINKDALRARIYAAIPNDALGCIVDQLLPMREPHDTANRRQRCPDDRFTAACWNDHEHATLARLPGGLHLGVGSGLVVAEGLHGYLAQLSGVHPV